MEELLWQKPRAQTSHLGAGFHLLTLKACNARIQNFSFFQNLFSYPSDFLFLLSDLMLLTQIFFCFFSFLSLLTNLS